MTKLMFTPADELHARALGIALAEAPADPCEMLTRDDCRRLVDQMRADIGATETERREIEQRWMDALKSYRLLDAECCGVRAELRQAKRAQQVMTACAWICVGAMLLMAGWIAWRG